MTQYFAYGFVFFSGVFITLLTVWTVWIHYLRTHENFVGIFIQTYLKNKPEMMPAYCPVCNEREIQKYLDKVEL